LIEHKYRPDIDGLRAVAVGVVVLFHSSLGFSGGFIGVDVFFVISGFLITGLILKGQKAGSFRLQEFWIRRVRRILPASIAMVLATLLVGFFILLPNDYRELGEATISQQFLASNVYFWRNTGYFAGPADLKPLLHTWSLAVEEQFYLIYPFLLVLLNRVNHKWRIAVLGSIFAASFGLSIFAVHYYPSAAFFLLPTRAWEMLLGGLICFLPAPTRLGERTANLLSMSAIAAILGGSWVFHKGLPFPGFNALLPCLATAILIYVSAHRMTACARVLACKPLVFLGGLSYSLYLWHWPVFAFLRYSLGESLPLPATLAALAASSGLAYLSWRFVETPFRRHAPSGSQGVSIRWAASSRVFGLAGIATCVVVVAAGVIYVADGFHVRLTPRAQHYLADQPASRDHMITDLERCRRGEFHPLGNPEERDQIVDFLVWGDSHAGMMSELFDNLAHKHGQHGILAARPATVPLIETHNRFTPKHTQAICGESVIRFVEQHRVRHVFLVSSWSLYLEENGSFTLRDQIGANPSDVLDRGLRRTVRKLRDLGSTVWIVKQVPRLSSDPKRAVAVNSQFGWDPPQGVSVAEHRAKQHTPNSVIHAIAAEIDGVFAVDPSLKFFDEQGYSRIADSRHMFYRDPSHLTPHGAKELLTPTFESVFHHIVPQRRLTSERRAPTKSR